MKVIMHWKYGAARKPNAVFTSEWMDAQDALTIIDDLEKAGRMKEVEVSDELGTTWSKKELKKLLAKVEEEPQEATVYFDGGYQKSSKMSGLGVVIYYRQGKEQWRVRVNRLLQELDTNNEAEYAAFYEAVTQLEELGVRHQSVTFKGDSQVVLNQLSGEWACFEEVLNQWLDRIERKLKQLGIIPVFEPIGRKENTEADKLATQALNGEEISSKFNLTANSRETE